MNAPILWIVLPCVAALLLFGLKDFIRRWVVWAGVLLCAGLALAAVVIPVDEMIPIAGRTFTLESTWVILGRRLVLLNSQRPIMGWIYLLGMVSFLIAALLRMQTYFVPFALAILGFLTAAVAVEPFYYAAMLVEIAVLISIPMLVPPGFAPGKGVIRYLTFQTIAIPFILIAGWQLERINIDPEQVKIFQQAGLTLGVGFSLWMAVFPFNTWMPQLSEESHPWTTGFLFTLFPSIILIMGLEYVNGFGWLRNEPALYTICQIVGVVMVVSSGMYAMFEKRLPRLFGISVTFEMGFAIILLGANSPAGYQSLIAGFLPRLITLASWALALSVMKEQGMDLTIDGNRGTFRTAPLISAGLFTAWFSTSGIPLFAEFPVRMIALESLALSQSSLMIAAMIGTVLFLFSGFRALATFLAGKPEKITFRENTMQGIVLVGASLILLLFGLLPGVFLQGMLDVLNAFPNLL